jgi:hypothetical protein
MTNSTTLEAVKSLPIVAKIAAWNDRHYVTLEATFGSRANADLRTKIWIKGETLTIERGKGCNSDAWIAAKYALVDAAQAAGATVREV